MIIEAADQTTNTLLSRADFLKEFLEQHPDIPSPTVTIWNHSFNIDLTWHLQISHQDFLADQREAAQKVTKSLGGFWKKDQYGNTFSMKRTEKFERNGDMMTVNFSIIAERAAVCERRVVGHEEVVIPASEERVESREIVEWDCGPVLGDLLEEEL